MYGGEDACDMAFLFFSSYFFLVMYLVTHLCNYCLVLIVALSSFSKGGKWCCSIQAASLFLSNHVVYKSQRQ